MKRFACAFIVLCLLISLVPNQVQAEESVYRYSVLVLDVSGSMYGEPMEAAKKAAIHFSEQVLKAKGNNKVAVIAFTYEAVGACDFTDSLQDLTEAINGLDAYGGTSQYTALTAARELFERTELEEGAIKNILLMSDGLPQGGTASDGTHYTHEQYPYNYMYANAAYEVAVQMHKDYNIYTLGFFHSSTGNDLVFGRRFMDDLQNKGYYEVIDPDELAFEFSNIADEISDKDTSGGKLITGTFKYRGSFHQSRDSKTSYSYSDSYFTRNNTEYHPQLSTMSLSLAMATFASHETAVWRDKTKNAKALLIDELGFNDFGQSDDWNQAPTMHSIGAVAAWKKVDDATLVALSLRGGGYGAEWGGNFYIENTGNHQGFERARKKASWFLSEYLQEHKGKINGRIKLWLVGYSRSAAVANLLAGDLNENVRMPSFVSLAHNDIYCYTFATPQGALVSNTWKNVNHRNIHNVVNKTDPVPLVAPAYWRFTHFNGPNNHKLPYVTEKDYQAKRTRMLAEYKKIVADASIARDKKSRQKVDYKVLDNTRRFKLQVNTKRVDIFGYAVPKYEIGLLSTEGSQPYYVVLTDLVDEMAANLIKSRSVYVSKLQNDLTMTMEAVMGEELNERFRLYLDYLLMELMDNYMEGVRHVIAPVFTPWLITPKSKIAKATERLLEISNRAAQKMGMQDPLATMGELSKVTLELLISSNYNLLKVLDNAYVREKPTTGRIFQPHYPEVTLAWLKAEVTTDETSPTPGARRIIRINCPVDLRVYDAEGTIIASMINEQVNGSDISVALGTNEQGEKVIHLPADAGYTVNITATAMGTMNYVVNEYSEALNAYTRVVSYFDVPIQTGDLLRGIVPQIGAAELMGTQINGSSVDYQLISSSGAPLRANSMLSGEQIRYYEVTAESDNTGGIVLGGGRHLQDSFVELNAYPVSSGEFLGWYDNNQLLSRDETYRFRVKANKHIVGRFKSVMYHKVTFLATEGGKILNVDGQYPLGTEVMIACEASPGFVFSHWQTYSGGTLKNEKAMSTSYIMPDNDTAVTAVFMVDPSTHPPLTGDETPLGLYKTMMILAVAGFAVTSVLLVKRPKRRKEEIRE